MFAIKGYEFSSHSQNMKNDDYDFERTELFFSSQYDSVTQEDFNLVCENLPKFSQLKYLTFTIFGSGLSDQQIEHLAKQIESYDKLTQFQFNFGIGCINDNALKSITQVLEKCSATLKSVSIIDQSSKITSGSIPAFANAIKQLQKIENFEIQINSTQQINNQDIIHIANSLSTISSLKQLKLHIYNLNLSDEIVPHIIEIIKKNQELEKIELDLCTNQLTEQGITPLIDEILKAKNLTDLMFQIKDNKFDHSKIIKSRLLNKHFKLYKTYFEEEDLKKKESGCNIF
ncbi:hypothetical protein ABPG74_013365 [Tetrahymena malaccensis]